jgi:MFS transporter, DHA2 family, multidrug resistance protein
MDIPAEQLPPARRLAITFVVMIGSMMQILDTTIANIALPHMQASLGATREQISWVLTSYIVATAIAIPATGFLESRLGSRKLMLFSLAGFTLSSALCGFAATLPLMVFARVLQGACGAFINPLSQSIMFSSYPAEKRAQSMTIWGMGVMIAPILGPVIGGWLTESFSWRWVFFINVPIGVATIVAGAAILQPGLVPNRRFDWTGYVLLAGGLAAFQLGLDRGTGNDWFDSIEIIIEFGLAAMAAWMFFIHTRMAKNPIIAIDVFKDRNCMIASVIAMICAGSMVAGSTFGSLMFQGLFGYSTIDAGLINLPRGICMAISMIMTASLLKILDFRVIMSVGICMVSFGYLIMSHFSLGMDQWPMIWASMLQGLGFGLVMMPMNLMCFSTIKPIFRTEAAALFALSRSMGGAVLISIATAFIARNVQISHSDLGSHITATTMPYLNGGLVEQFGIQGNALLRLLDGEVNRQSLMIAYVDTFWLFVWTSLIAMPTLLLARKGSGQAGQMASDRP